MFGCAPREQSDHLIPKIALESSDVDLGAVMRGTQSILTARPTVVNRGTAPLRIISLRPSCGCTVASVPRELIEAGGSASLDLRVQVGYETGPRRSRLAIYSNDPAQPILEMVIRWHVLAPLMAEPTSLDFGDLRPGGKAERVVQLSVVPAYQATEVRMAAATEGINCSEIDTTGRERTLTVSIEADSVVGEHVGHLLLEAGDSGLEIAIPLRWNIRQRLYAIPGALFLPVNPSQGDVSAKFLLKSDDDAKFAVLQILLDGDMIEHKSHAPGKRLPSHVIEVRLQPPSSGMRRSLIEIVTDLDDDGHRIEIPVTLVTETTSIGAVEP